MPANVRRIAGNAMFTIVTSRNTMNTAREETSNTFHWGDKWRRRPCPLSSTLMRFTVTPYLVTDASVV